MLRVGLGSVCFLVGMLAAVAMLTVVACSAAEPTPTLPLGVTGEPQPVSDDTTAVVRPKFGGILVQGLRQEFANSDPMRFGTTHMTQTQNQIFNSLVRMGVNDVGIVEGELAESWEFSDDLTSITLQLRDDVKWQDGVPFDADDVMFWFDRAFSDINTRQRNGLVGIESYEKLGAYTVRINFDIPNPGYLNRYTYYLLAQPKHLFEGESLEALRTPESTGYVGTGGFIMVEHRKDSLYRLERFEEYWMFDEFGDRLPYLDGVQIIITNDPSTNYAAIRVGRIDISARGWGWHLTPEMANTLERELGDRIVIQSFPYTAAYMYMNHTIPPFDDVRVRRAMHLFTNNQDGIEALEGGFARVGGNYVPDSQFSLYTTEEWAKQPGWRSDEAGLVEDRAEALRLMKDAGYANGFKAAILTRDIWLRYGELFQGQVAGLGIDATLDLVDNTTRVERELKQEFEFSVSVHGAQHPYLTWATWHSDNPTHRIYTPDATLDAMLDEAIVTVDPARLVELAHQVDQYTLIDQVYAIPMHWTYGLEGVYSYVKGRVPSQYGTSHNNELWTVWLDK